MEEVLETLPDSDDALPPPAAKASKYDRSIVEGSLSRAVWKIAWPTMLTNAIGGLQGMVDHALVGRLVGLAILRPLRLLHRFRGFTHARPVSKAGAAITAR